MDSKFVIEKSLIKKLKAGKPEAQRLLYARYKVYLYGVCRLYSRTVEDAEDLLQESFIKIFKDVRQYKGKGVFVGWMRRLTVNMCLMHIRSQKAIWAEEVQIENIEDLIIIENNFNEKVRSAAIIQMVQSLPIIQQTVFNLRVMDEYRFNEISQLLELKESTVRSHFSRARKKLQKLLTESLIG